MNFQVIFKFVHHTSVPTATSLQSGKSRFFELRLLCYLHPWNTAQRQPNYWKRSLRCPGTFREHFLPIKNGCLCAGFGQSLRVHSWPFCCWRTSSLGLEDLLLMFWCRREGSNNTPSAIRGADEPFKGDWLAEIWWSFHKVKWQVPRMGWKWHQCHWDGLPKALLFAIDNRY